MVTTLVQWSSARSRWLVGAFPEPLVLPGTDSTLHQSRYPAVLPGLPSARWGPNPAVRTRPGCLGPGSRAPAAGPFQGTTSAAQVVQVPFGFNLGAALLQCPVLIDVLQSSVSHPVSSTEPLQGACTIQTTTRRITNSSQRHPRQPQQQNMSCRARSFYCAVMRRGIDRLTPVCSDVICHLPSHLHPHRGQGHPLRNPLSSLQAHSREIGLPFARFYDLISVGQGSFLSGVARLFTYPWLARLGFPLGRCDAMRCQCATPSQSPSRLTRQKVREKENSTLQTDLSCMVLGQKKKLP